MTCDGVRELLPLFSGRDLSQDEAVIIQAHLECCKECAHEADAYRECRDALAGLEQASTPDVSRQVWEHVRREALANRARTGARQIWFGTVLRAAAVLVVGVGLGMGGYWVYAALAQRQIVSAPERGLVLDLPAVSTEASSSPAAPAGGSTHVYSRPSARSYVVVGADEYRKMERELRELRLQVEELQKRLSRLESPK